MQIVINMSKEDYHKVKDGRASVSIMRNAIRNGTVLPKEHGDIKDTFEILKRIGQNLLIGDKATEREWSFVNLCIKAINDTPTIIEEKRKSDADNN